MGGKVRVVSLQHPLTAANNNLKRAQRAPVLRDLAYRSCSAPSCRATYDFTCRTNRSFRRMLHVWYLTDCSTSLCSRMFSTICSLDEPWFWPSSSKDIAVLQGRGKKNESIHIAHFGRWIKAHHLLPRTGCIHAGATSVATPSCTSPTTCTSSGIIHCCV